jgi:hypothetical protein
MADDSLWRGACVLEHHVADRDCTSKHASSRRRGNVVIPKGFPRSVGRVESRLLGFPCFSILCHFHGLLWKRVSQNHSYREGPHSGTGTIWSR